MGEAVVCGGCGAEVVIADRFCAQCGRPLAPSVRPRGGSWNPSTSPPPSAGGDGGGHAGGPSGHAQRRRPGPPSSPPVRTDVRGRLVEGQVKGVQSRTESSNSSYHEAVWTFRIERYDEAGNRVMLVPVEMRAQTFEGSLSDGDWVRVHGKMRSGTFHGTKVENVTTGAVVSPKRANCLLVAVFFVVFFAIVAFIAWIAITGFTQDSGGLDPPRGIGNVAEAHCDDVPDGFPEEWQC